MNRAATGNGCFEVDSMPGQSQVALCHSFFVPVQLRGHGFGHKLKLAQMKALETTRYDFALCSVASDNPAQQRVLTQAGWRRLAAFPNSKTGGETEIWGWQVGDWSGHE